jgi:lipooligosaccharide transport system permease protein
MNLSVGAPPRLAPPGLLGFHRARRLVERNVTVYRRQWIFLVSGFFEPFFYLLSIGLGLNKLVGQVHVDGHLLPYTVFVAPGLLAASAMNGATLDATFNIFFKLKIAKTYDAVLATPLGPRDVAVGELTWSLLRGTAYSTVFLIVMAGLGYVLSPWALLALPSAMLVSFAFASVGMAATTYMRSWQDFDKVSLALLPLFLFSAIFFPITAVAGWAQPIIRVSPLYQGVALIRGLDTGFVSWSMAGHAAYLALAGVLGIQAAARRMAVLLLP